MSHIPFRSVCRVMVRVRRGFRSLSWRRRSRRRRRPASSFSSVVIPIDIHDGCNMILPHAQHVEIHVHYHRDSSAPPPEASKDDAPEEKPAPE